MGNSPRREGCSHLHLYLQSLLCWCGSRCLSLPTQHSLCDRSCCSYLKVLFGLGHKPTWVKAWDEADFFSVAVTMEVTFPLWLLGPRRALTIWESCSGLTWPAGTAPSSAWGSGCRVCYLCSPPGQLTAGKGGWANGGTCLNNPFNPL